MWNYNPWLPPTWLAGALAGSAVTVPAPTAIITQIPYIQLFIARFIVIPY
jgi:hypothetical protein